MKNVNNLFIGQPMKIALSLKISPNLLIMSCIVTSKKYNILRLLGNLICMDFPRFDMKKVKMSIKIKISSRIVKSSSKISKGKLMVLMIKRIELSCIIKIVAVAIIWQPN